MSKLKWTPSQGEIVWVKVFSNWSKGTYIGYDVIKNQHLVREPEEGGGHLFISADVLPKNANPNESKIDKKLSSIDWLVQEITKKSINDQSHNVFLIVKQAKAMHKEEIMDAVNSCGYQDEAEYYYNETFGGEQC